MPPNLTIFAALCKGFAHMDTPFLTRDELLTLGFTEVGAEVRVSRKASFHKTGGRIGHHVRIDDFCIITGTINLGNYIHIAPFCMLSGNAAPITMKDGSGLSSHCSLYTASDDYRADTLSNPSVPETYKHVTTGPITLGIGVLVGSHSVILPNVTIGDGASIGAQCLIYKPVPEGAIGVSGARKLEIVGQRDAGKIRGMIAQLQD